MLTINEQKKDKKNSKNKQEQLMIQLEDFKNGKPVQNIEKSYDYSKLKEQSNQQYQRQEPQSTYQKTDYPEIPNKVPQIQYILPNNHSKVVQNKNYGKKGVIDNPKIEPTKSKNQMQKHNNVKSKQATKPPHNNAQQQSNITQQKQLNTAVQKPISIVPQMMVSCDHCTFEQNVPANTQVYICCCCNNLNQCYPLYGLFVCGKCKTKVCYPYGTSEMIRCSKCKTVNKVPVQPKKRYIPQLQKQTKLKKLQQQQIKYDFADSYFGIQPNFNKNEGQKIIENQQHEEKAPYFEQQHILQDEQKQNAKEEEAYPAFNQ